MHWDKKKKKFGNFVTLSRLCDNYYIEIQGSVHWMRFSAIRCSCEAKPSGLSLLSDAIFVFVHWRLTFEERRAAMFTQCLPAKGKTFEKSDTWVSKYWNVKKRLYDRDDVVLQHWRHLIQKLSRACLPFDADTLHVAVLADVPRIARLLCVRYRQSILSQSRNFESQHKDARIEKIAKNNYWNDA